MTTLILYNLDQRFRFQDYIDCARQAGLTFDAAEVHADSSTVWFNGATFDGKDLGEAPAQEWAARGFFPAFSQCARDFLGAKYDLPPPVNQDVVTPSRRPNMSDKSTWMYKLEQVDEMFEKAGVSETAVFLYLNLGLL